MADASLPDIRARSSPGTAMAAMIPMIATTISSSMRVNPCVLRIFTTNTPFMVNTEFQSLLGHSNAEQSRDHQPLLTMVVNLSGNRDDAVKAQRRVTILVTRVDES